MPAASKAEHYLGYFSSATERQAHNRANVRQRPTTNRKYRGWNQGWKHKFMYLHIQNCRQIKRRKLQ